MRLKVNKKSEPKKEEKINPREMLKQNYLDRIEGDLKEKGAIIFDQDMFNINEEYLVLPRDLTEVPSLELGKYLNAFTQQKMYLRTLLGRIQLMIEESKRNYHEVSDPIYRKYSLDKMSETAKDRLTNANPKVKESYHEFLDYKRKFDIVEISISNIEDAIFLISREVTRRNADFFDESRDYSVERS